MALKPLSISIANRTCFTVDGVTFKPVGVAGVQQSDGLPFMDTSYLDMLATKGVNLVHFRPGPLFKGAYNGFSGNGPYVDTGTDLYDLTQWNSTFWSTARSRIQYAESLGMYVEVDLVDGWPAKESSSATYSPWGSGNNINSVAVTNSLCLSSPPSYAQSWIEKIMTETGDLLNVIYQIGNETYDMDATGSSVAFEAGVVSIARAKLSALGFPDHLFGTNSHLTAAEQDSSINYVNIHPAVYTNPLSPHENKPTLMNESVDDGSITVAEYVGQVYKSLVLGSVWYAWMGSYAPAIHSQVLDRTSYFATFINAVKVELIVNIDADHGGTSGKEYVAYLPSGGTKAINLGGTEKHFVVNWFDPNTGKWSPDTDVVGSGSTNFTAPDTNPWALHIALAPDPRHLIRPASSM